jgi:hypothetical protein
MDSLFGAKNIQDVRLITTPPPKLPPTLRMGGATLPYSLHDLHIYIYQ